MNPSRSTSARALTSLGGICLLLGLLIPAPAGSLAAFTAGALCGLAALGIAPGWARLWPLGLLAIALGLAVHILPAYRAEQANRAQRLHARPS